MVSCEEMICVNVLLSSHNLKKGSQPSLSIFQYTISLMLQSSTYINCYIDVVCLVMLCRLKENEDSEYYF